MKKALILGAGHVTKPIVDYLTGKCGYNVTMAARTVSKAEKIIAGREKAKAVAWASNEEEKLDKLIAEHDIVINMIPKAYHVMVAKLCLKHQISMVSTSYEIPPIKELHAEAKERGIIILNELGEDPGMDHFATQMLLDDIKADNGKIIAINSYGSGLPSFKYNNNPMGYKFSWEPKGVFLAAQVSAKWLDKGKPIPIDGDKLFENFKMVDIKDLGTFEAYANKDVTKYVKPYDLPDDVTFYRGLLRFSGYCNNMRNFWKLDLLNDNDKLDWNGKTFRDFAAMLINTSPTEKLEVEFVKFLGVDHLSDIMMRLKWLGLFETEAIKLENGSKLDVFIELLLKKLNYAPSETDMTIIHVDILAEFPGGKKEHRTVTMVADGKPDGDSAMAKAVGLPPAIATKYIFDGVIKETGVQMPPTLPYLYKPFVEELAEYGFVFKKKTFNT
ncbi:MAG: saccharopine dehydrogenase NADP-binding domain-containing protein [Ignavibacteria bacterium]|nr:saccharopine dehydrogenase NADP-binding domain-containing protein [Ignavibacteria bacterium]MBT8381487.1 saccharopine dehydrogenase NADP-binding domain-containing protein [Ignavibacteria bacterium]MBT8391549.1 saccharopine dehydrogenase NADP-binding domain-containing protein [Ignavibacteria bacterium]NNL22718.1 saccharopine dehydrogenase [Ignavibacteriaceae bacterium]